MPRGRGGDTGSPTKDGEKNVGKSLKRLKETIEIKENLDKNKII